jgi:hypothetical protein
MELNKLIISPNQSSLSTSRGFTKKNSIELCPNNFGILSQNPQMSQATYDNNQSIQNDFKLA